MSHTSTHRAQQAAQRRGSSTLVQRLLARRRAVTTRTSTTTTGQIPPGSAASGGFSIGPVPFSQTEAGLRAADATQRALLTIQRENAEALARQQHADDLVLQEGEQKFVADQLKQSLADAAVVREEERARVRESNINQLRIERQGTFSALMKAKDPARAVLFGLGFGPENDVFDARARALGTTIDEIKGVSRAKFGRTSTQAITERALSRVLDRDVTIGREGVRGLGSAVQAARAFTRGGTDIQDLLRSGFGVGSLRAGERPGMSAARLAELTASVSPTGVLP